LDAFALAMTSQPNSTSPSNRRDVFDATVVENTSICREHFRLVLRLPVGFPDTFPGQFVQVACTDAPDDQTDREIEWVEGTFPRFEHDALLGPVATLRRPFSLAGRADFTGGTDLTLIQRTVGAGTNWLSTLKPGDVVSVLGPLGNRFTLPTDNGIALLVGGGVGIPPMLYLAEKLVGRKAVAFCGATTLDLLPFTLTDDAPKPAASSIAPLYNVREFATHGVPALLSTDDGSYGYHGYVTQALEQYLDAWITDNADRNRAVVYTCGPELMMRRVADIAMRRNIQCQIAVERAMACGMGTCQSCCIKLKRDPKRDGNAFAGKDWIYKLACTDGPIFQATDLLW